MNVYYEPNYEYTVTLHVQAYITHVRKTVRTKQEQFCATAISNMITGV